MDAAISARNYKHCVSFLLRIRRSHSTQGAPWRLNQGVIMKIYIILVELISYVCDNEWFMIKNSMLLFHINKFSYIWIWMNSKRFGIRGCFLSMSKHKIKFKMEKYKPEYLNSLVKYQTMIYKNMTLQYRMFQSRKWAK